MVRVQRHGLRRHLGHRDHERLALLRDLQLLPDRRVRFRSDAGRGRVDLVSPAPLLAVAGLFLIGIGVLMTLNPLGRHGWVWRILVYAPRLALGILVIAVGIAVSGLGAWEWLEPQAFDVFVTKLPRSLDLL